MQINNINWYERACIRRIGCHLSGSWQLAAGNPSGNQLLYIPQLPVIFTQLTETGFQPGVADVRLVRPSCMYCMYLHLTTGSALLISSIAKMISTEYVHTHSYCTYCTSYSTETRREVQGNVVVGMSALYRNSAGFRVPSSLFAPRHLIPPPPPTPPAIPFTVCQYCVWFEL
jgi:hypothetical protein